MQPTKLIRVSDETHRRVKLASLMKNMPMYDMTELALTRYLDEIERAVEEDKQEYARQQEQQRQQDLERRREVMRRSGMDRFAGKSYVKQPWPDDE